MNIIAGKFKKTKLCGLKGLQIRPTSDKIREALFAILGELAMESEFLDLFAGTGAIGIEALSRGANNATFVENHGACISIIENNCKKCRIDSQASILKMDVFSSVDRLAGRRRFDLVFADPPYDLDRYDELVKRICLGGIAAAGATVVIEHHRRTNIEAPQEWTLNDVRTYGHTRLSFLTQAHPIEEGE